MSIGTSCAHGRALCLGNPNAHSKSHARGGLPIDEVGKRDKNTPVRPSVFGTRHPRRRRPASPQLWQRLRISKSATGTEAHRSGLLHLAIRVTLGAGALHRPCQLLGVRHRLGFVCCEEAEGEVHLVVPLALEHEGLDEFLPLHLAISTGVENLESLLIQRRLVRHVVPPLRLQPLLELGDGRGLLRLHQCLQFFLHRGVNHVGHHALGEDCTLGHLGLQEHHVILLVEGEIESGVEVEEFLGFCAVQAAVLIIVVLVERHVDPGL
mmetsp:Transcript_70232/g.228339  ORF Transcript_70232/g.228339 Transcript_70232/m.228339 type:complete len:266 (+) Transcript_70232:127-924(+)